MTKPCWAGVSEDAKDFIKCALTKTITDRYSAKQLLDHNWLKNLSERIDKTLEDDEKTEVLSNLQNFA